ncbi:hypothetical protein [Sphaerisporangium corydalis]|uniref:Copper resistance protein CopC n=1 Tax=Sphaerisporangium corydalis TaxID=1441875 RepID=A0ABV9EK81_9ACTN|nr:hypothetical protein [Sphaerisporangium corydalis]
MRKALMALVGTIGLLLGPALPVSAAGPIPIVHTERVQAGPYGITIGFSAWPVRAMQSLDLLFTPDDGIAGKSGEITVTAPGGAGEESGALVRHPRQREVWGLDVQSLPEPGDWTLTFTVRGPAGEGVGELRHLNVLEQPGPPLALSWTIGTLPLFGLIGLIVVAWRRTRRPAAVMAAA